MPENADIADRRPDDFRKRARRRAATCFCAFVCLFLAAAPLVFLPERACAASRSVVYGMVELRPLFFRDGRGNFQGFFVDLLRAVAQREGWDLSFVSAPGETIVARLASGEIDIASMTPTPRLVSLFDFSKVNHYSTWFTIFMPPGESFLDVFDLRGRRIAAQRGFVAVSELHRTTQQLKLDLSIIDFPTIEEAFDAVSKKQAHGVLAEYTISLPLVRKHGLLRTPIVFAPSRIFFATTRGKNAELLETLDRRLDEMLNDPRSLYYVLQRRWLYDEDLTFIPDWTYLAYAVGLLVLFAFAYGAYRISRTGDELRLRQRDLARLLAHETALSEIARILLSHHKAEGVLSRVCIRLREACDVLWCGILRAEAPDGGKALQGAETKPHLHLVVETRDETRRAEEKGHVSARIPFSPDLAALIEPLKRAEHLVFTSDRLKAAAPDIDPGSARSFLFVPVFAGKSFWGAVGVASGTSDAGGWDGDAIRLLRTTADMTGAFLRIRAVESQLRKTSEIDPLTGVMNRRAFLAALQNEIARSLRHGHPLVLAIADLDHFKDINDTFGHDIGDQVLRDTAQAMREEMRAEDRVGRLGGEEFGILLPETDSGEARSALDRIRTHIASIHRAGAFGDESRTASPRISIGFSLFRGRGDSSKALYRRADQALYRAKAAGRNRVEGD
jgi:diguanylate cyclase (GGDEF)-like protein